MAHTVGDKITFKCRAAIGNPATVKFQVQSPNTTTILTGTYDSATRIWESSEIYLDCSGTWLWRPVSWRATEADGKTSGTGSDLAFEVRATVFAEPTL